MTHDLKAKGKTKRTDHGSKWKGTARRDWKFHV